jgi:hypothetical protein
MDREQDRYGRLRQCLLQQERHYNGRCLHRDSTIACVLVWAALHDRPILWACHPGNWPALLRPNPLPSQSTMSRRLRKVALPQLLERAFGALREQLPSALLKFIDAKPLPVGGCSKDHDALYGRAAGGKAKGYKLYAIVDAACGAVDQWVLGSMNWSEQKAALLLLDRMTSSHVIVGDGEYDTTPLYDHAAAKDCAWLAPAPKKAHGHGHRYISPHRKAGLALAQSPPGEALLLARVGIERSFAHLTASSCGLGPLPAWVRTPHRVAVWVAAKLLIDLDRRLRLAQQKANDA